jgi:hypothetical protein
MNHLTDFLTKCEDAEAKASKKGWITVVHSELKNSHGIGFSCFSAGPTHQNIHDEDVPEEELLKLARQDAEFITFSRNNFLKLVQMNRVMAEAMRKIQSENKPFGSDPSTMQYWREQECRSRMLAFDALETASNLAKEAMDER